MRCGPGLGGRGARPVAALLVALVTVVVTSAAGAAGATAAPARAQTGTPVAAGPGTGLDAAAASARARAVRAARQVDELTRRYEQASDAAARAAGDLAAAFTVSAGAERLRDDDAAALRARQVTHAARIRAIYAEGGAALAVTVLGADDLDDAMWRLSTIDRIEADVVRRSALDVADAGARAARSAAAARAAAEADARLAAALRTLQDEAAAAAEALARARTVLARLDERARQAVEARDAAARLAAAEESRRQHDLASSRTTVGAIGIPVLYERLYRQAATSCPGTDWTLLAAVGQVESGHGRNNGPSSAGAIGPMQFMPATFAAYAVDGDHDGTTDAWSPADAIWTAARYLCESGADAGTDDGVRRALFAYNHAQWYVDLVLGAQRGIRARLGTTATAGS